MSAAAPAPIRPKPIRVFVDVGHGGKDKGTQGLRGMAESELCLTIGRMVHRELGRRTAGAKPPFEVKLSRDRDEFISLRDRVKSANDWGADLFASIHANSSPVTRVSGFEVYFLSGEASDDAATKLAHLENKSGGETASISSNIASILNDVQTNYHVNESSQLAEVVFGAMSRVVRPNGRGVRQAPFTVLAGTTMPAVLIEVGYVTHAQEAKKLTNRDYLKKLADAISAGIIQFATERKEKIT